MAESILSQDYQSLTINNISGIIGTKHSLDLHLGDNQGFWDSEGQCRWSTLHLT